jgi:ethanolamine utilization protein EutA (predicted chaperonin)
MRGDKKSAVQLIVGTDGCLLFTTFVEYILLSGGVAACAECRYADAAGIGCGEFVD